MVPAISSPACPATAEALKCGISEYFITTGDVISPARGPSPDPRIIAICGVKSM